MDYLPNNATIDEACEWLQHKTEQKWNLPRLLEDGHLTPYVWIDYIPGMPQISGDRREGYLTMMVYHGDVMRLAADRNEALLTMFTAHDGTPVLTKPGWRVELKDIRFKKEALERVAEIINNTAPAQSPATPAPVVAVGASGGVELDKAGPLPLTTGDIAFCFAGLRCKTEKEWKDLIGKGRNWVERCLIQPGTRGRGGAPKLWNPVCIGAALIRDGHARPNNVRAKFQTQPLLKPWLDEWKTYEADNLSAD